MTSTQDTTADRGSRAASYVLCICLGLPALLIFLAVMMPVLPFALLALPLVALLVATVQGSSRR